MKKLLLGSSGLFAISLLMGGTAMANGVAPAIEPEAEKIKLQLGGFMEQWIGWQQDDVGLWRSFDQKSDSEVYFFGSTTLDNGLKISARIELEGDKNGSHTAIDKSWLSIGSETMGTLNLGSINTITDTMHHYPPDVGIGIFDPSKWVMHTSAARQFTAIDPGDHNVVQYVSPSWSGFQFGVEYGVDPDNIQWNAAAVPPSWGTHPTQNQPWIYSNDYIAAVAAYNGTWDEFSFGVDAGYMIQNIPLRDGDREELQFGASLGWGGFTVSGGVFYGNHLEAWGEEFAYAIGAAYESGPWAVSLSYVSGETDEAIDPIFAPWGAQHNDDYSVILASGSYQIGPGIALKSSIFYLDATDQKFPTTENLYMSNQGFGIVGGVRVDF